MSVPARWLTQTAEWGMIIFLVIILIGLFGFIATAQCGPIWINLTSSAFILIGFGGSLISSKIYEAGQK